MSLAAGALRRPVTTFATVLALVLLGAVSLGRMPVSLLPDVSLPVLTIRTTYEGAAATQVALSRKEEDLNGDGRIDVTSFYAKGKLVRKEVSDPSLVQ